MSRLLLLKPEDQYFFIVREKFTTEPTLFCGNEAIGEAAIQAGCRAYFGYPITPQNELTAYMSKRMVEEGRVFIQSESELAAISMVFGASVAGVRAMTSSSSPGISLKQEGISYMAGCELPAVIVNISRGGPGLGNIGPAQADYYQSTRGGGHGDYRTPVLAGSSVQELADLTFLAFDIADRYRTPTLILGDGILGQMMEPAIITNPKPVQLPEKDWTLTGARGRPPRSIKSLYLGVGKLKEHNQKIQDIYREITENEVRWESFLTDDASLVLVAYGITARICREVVSLLRKEGLAVGLLRPITLWPFPEKPIQELSRKTKKFLSVEMNYGQMVDDVRLAVNGNCPVEFFGHGGGEILTGAEIIQAVRDRMP